MSAPKHTPGPWTVESSSIRAEAMPKWRELYPEASDDPSRGMPVCEFKQPSYQAPIETIERINRINEANARLIAAGPEMYSAIKEAFTVIEDIRTGKIDRGRNLWLADIQAVFLEVIAKVNGRHE